MMRLFLLLVLCAVLADPAVCAVRLESGQSVAISGQQPVTSDVMAAGAVITISPTVQGDVTAAGQTVTVSGPVSGSVIAAGQSVSVAGKTGNDVRLAGSNVTLTAPVGDNAYLAGATVTATPSASVGSDLLAAGGEVSLMGNIGGDARIASGKATIGSTVNGSVYAKTNQLSLLDGAHVKGNLYYSSPNDARIAPGARIDGKVLHTLPPKEQKRPMFWPGFIWWLLMLIGSILFGLVLMWLFPLATRAAATTARTSPGASIGVGFIALIVTPIAAIILMITLIGLPLGLALLAIYLVLLYAGNVIAGLTIGGWILGRIGRQDVAHYSTGAMVLGLVVLSVVGLIPILGWLVVLVARVAGLGAVLMTWWRGRTAAPVIQPA